MHVVYVLDSLASGGAQRQAVELACFLHARRGVRVEVVVYHDLDFFGARLRAAGVPVAVVPKRLGLDLALPWRLRRRLSERKPDVVHAFLLGPSLWSGLAVRALPAARRPAFVAAERNDRIATGLAEACVQRFVYRRSDAVTANAAPVVDAIVAKLGVARERVHYLPNGIDLEAWDRRAARPCPVSLAPGRFHLALVGGLRAQKDHALLLDALAALPAGERAGYEVLFVGAETGAAGEAEGVRAKIAASGLGDVVRIVPETDEIAALLPRLDGLVLPSRYEGFPNVLLEAMASRLPAIATAVGNVPRMLEHGVTGFVVPPGDTEALVGALRALRALPRPARAAMGERARAVVASRWGIEAVADAHLALYAQLARRAPGRA